MEDVLKIVKSLEDSGLLLEVVSETSKNEARSKKEDFLSSHQAYFISILRYYNVLRLEYFKIMGTRANITNCKINSISVKKVINK